MFKCLATTALMVLLGRETRAAVPVCPGQTTREDEACLQLTLDGAEAELQHYTDAATKRIDEMGAYLKQIGDQDNSTEVLGGFHKGEAAWAAYRKAACDAVYVSWSGGTIRGAMALTCETRITEERTHEVWRNWLTYGDSTPPVLPEPIVETGR